MANTSTYEEEVLKEAKSATPNYDIDYNDPQFQRNDAIYQNNLTELNNTVGGMIDKTDKYYEDLKNQSQEWADKQAQIQQDNTDFAIEKIEQQKEQAQKDYLKEQSGAYVDWRKQSNQYGTEAEKMASAGLSQTGYSESSQVSMYNTYQNRVAVARDAIERAKLNYDNNIKEAILQNNAALAQIYADAHKEQLELSLQGFQYKNQLVLDLADRKLQLQETHWNRYQDILNQMNTQNALKEQVRQFESEQEWKTAQAELDRNFQAEQAKINREFEAKEAELDRKHAIELENVRDKHEKEQLEIKFKQEKELLKQEQANAIAQLNQKLANDKALLKYQQDLNKVEVTGGSGGSSWTSKAKNVISKIGSGISKIVNDNKAKATTDYPIDMDSVAALGFGPISAEKLNTLVANGTVQEYVKDGKTKFKLSPSYSKQKQLYKRLG